MVQTEKALPSNVEAEASALGSVLIDHLAVARLVDRVQPSDFYREAHRLIASVMADLHESGEPCDLIMVTDELARRGQLEDVGGVSYVSSLANHVPTSANVDHYAEVIARTALLRRLIHASTQIVAVSYNQPDAQIALDFAISSVLDVARTSQRAGERSFADVLKSVHDDVLARMDQDDVPGVRTGIRDLDHMLLCLEPGELVYLAGRPGSGKSALGFRVAEHAALECRRRGSGSVDLFTLEMSEEALGRRWIATRAGINTLAMRAGFRYAHGGTDDDAYRAFDAAVMAGQQELGGYLFTHKGPLSTAQLRAHVMRAKAERGCRLVVIDQLDKLTDTGRSDSERERFNHLSRELTQIAQQLGVVVLCLAQLNRAVESRQNKRPALSDLKESGNLEQDAHLVLGLYRPAYYDADNPDPRFQQYAELLLLKGRDNRTGFIPLRFEQEFTRFSDWPFTELPEDVKKERAAWQSQR